MAAPHRCFVSVALGEDQWSSEARPRALVANQSRALDFDPEQKCVVIAIGVAAITFRRLPEVSPLVQSWLRVRL